MQTPQLNVPTVHILLASYQGELYLKEQLASLSLQTYSQWQLHVSDDGSNDSTPQIVAEFARTSPQAVHLCNGPGKGATHNFFHLINTVAASNPADLFAFCDQDDVWVPNKLANAVTHFKAQTLAPSQPYLYCSRTIVVDHLLVQRGLTPLPRKPLGFGNALLQNIASGNTMVFNQALLQILRLINPQHSVLHDWTAYQAATGCGGIVYFDERASIKYRQHTANVVGSNAGLISQMRRLRFMLQGGYKHWSLQTIQAMHQISPRLTAQNLTILNEFAAIHSMSNPYLRFLLSVNGRFWRQSRLGQASFAFALLFNLI